MPAPVLPDSLVFPSLPPYFKDQKYADSLPLLRQEQRFQRLGAECRVPDDCELAHRGKRAMADGLC